MNLSSYIAGRYFFAKSSGNAVNIISAISIGGILVGTMALIIVLSAFNGLESLVKGFYSTFDPDIKITLAEGKYFKPQDAQLVKLNNLQGIEEISQVLEERVMLNFNDNEYIASIKGVDGNYDEVTAIGQAITHGNYALHTKSEIPSAVLGAGVSYYLGYGRMSIGEPVGIFVPKRNMSAANFRNAFSSQLIYPSGIFSVQPEFDEKYILVPIGYAQQLLGLPESVTGIELSISEKADADEVKENIRKIVGNGFLVKDRDEQQAVFLKVMKSEALFTYLVFALILSIATFTIMGSLSMMMLDKKEHIRSLWAMGADMPMLRNIFFKEGLLISFAGAGLGLFLGVAIVLAQQYFGLLEIGQDYIVESYPVKLKIQDILLVLATVAVLCGITSWLTSRRLSVNFLH